MKEKSDKTFSEALRDTRSNIRTAIDLLYERVEHGFQSLGRLELMIVGAVVGLIVQYILRITWRLLIDSTQQISFSGPFLPTELPLSLSTTEAIWLVFFAAMLNNLGAMSSASSLEIRELEKRVQTLEKRPWSPQYSGQKKDREDEN